MAQIDIDKLVVSILNYNENMSTQEKTIRKGMLLTLHHALTDQGLRIKDGVIVKIEEYSKTKAGNWYVCEMEVMNESMITAFHRGECYYCPKDGYIDVNGALFEIGKLAIFHTWTIQDAKPGDILTGQYDNCRKPWIGIFKCISQRRPETQFDSYCFINSSHHQFVHPNSDRYFCNPCMGHTIRYAKPATKEQRELLLTKMKEAGYGFDFRLNKLIQVPKLKGLTQSPKTDKDELTGFEQAVRQVIIKYDYAQDREKYVKVMSEQLLSLARKQITSEVNIDAIWGELVCRGVERLSRADVEEFVERLKEGKYDKRTD